MTKILHNKYGHTHKYLKLSQLQSYRQLKKTYRATVVFKIQIQRGLSHYKCIYIVHIFLNIRLIIISYFIIHIDYRYKNSGAQTLFLKTPLHMLPFYIGISHVYNISQH